MALTKLLTLDNGLSIWKAHIDRLREQDKNARSMSRERFERLVSNVKKDKRLESLPLCTPITTPGGVAELAIISGHHRVRAARAAGINELYVIAFDEALPKSKVIAKQLAHNAISGQDDATILRELYDEIEDVESRIESAVTDQEMEAAFKKVDIDDINFEVEFELMNIVFLPHQMEHFEQVVDQINEGAKVLLSDLAAWPKFREAMQDAGRQEDIRNVSSILSRLAELALERLEQLRAEQVSDGQTSKAS